MAARAKLTKTITDVGYAPLDYDEYTGAMSYGDPVWFVHNEAGGREYSASANGEETEIYADGMAVYASDENHGYDITLTLLSAIDEIETCWLGNDVDENGGSAEYANNMERPKFALFVIEDTTDGVGQTTIWYNCSVSSRPDAAGKTSEGSGFDPQFFQSAIRSRPVGDSKLVRYRIKQKQKFTTLPFPDGTGLADLRISGGTISPMFRSDEDTYTITASGDITITAAVPIAPGAAVTIKQNTTTLDIGDEIGKTDGAVTVTVSNSIGGTEKTRTYTFTFATTS